MRLWNRKGQDQAVWLLLLLSLNIYVTVLSMDPTPYLDVILNRSWRLRFSGNQLKNFYKCVCRNVSGISCTITINYWKVINSLNTYKGKVEGSKEADVFNQTKLESVLNCVPHSIAENYNFPCEQKRAANTECAISDSFHHLVPGSEFCTNCITLCWGNYSVEYKGRHATVPSTGSCSSSQTWPIPQQNSTPSTLTDVSISSKSTHSVETTKSSFTKPTSSSVHTDASSSTAQTTARFDLPQEDASFGVSDDGGQKNQALGIGLGLGCTLVAVVVLVAVYVFYRKRQKEKQEAEDRRISYIQPYGDYREEDGKCAGDNNRLPMSSDGSHYDCARYSSEYQPYAGLDNSYSFIADGDVNSKRDFDNDNKVTSDYELANGYPPKEDISMQNMVKEEAVEGVNSPYFELSNDYELANGYPPKEDISMQNMVKEEAVEGVNSPYFELSNDYELANGYPPKETIQMQNIVNENNKEEGVKRVDNPYFELSDETTDSGIVSPEYSLGTIEVQEFDQSLDYHVVNKRKMSENGLKDAFITCSMNSDADKCPTNVYNKVNGRSETNDINMDEVLETYNVATGEKQTQNNHIYNRLNGKDERSPEGIMTNKLETYNVPSGELESRKSHTYNILNGETEMSDLKTYNMAADKTAAQQSHIYNRLNGETEMSDLETYNMAADKTATHAQQSHIYNRLNGETEISDLETYNMAADETATHAQQSHIYNRLNGETEMPDLETYNMAADETATHAQQSHIYNRLNGETEMLDLETYNMAADKTAAQQSHTYNILNGETEMPDLETYNMAADDSTIQQNHIYNRSNDAAAMLPDLETYNVQAGELNKSPKEISESRISTDSGETRDPYSFATAMDDDQIMSIQADI